MATSTIMWSFAKEHFYASPKKNKQTKKKNPKNLSILSNIKENKKNSFKEREVHSMFCGKKQNHPKRFLKY